MRWEDERWVKLYTRDAPEWLMLPWQSRGLFYELMRHADGAGLIALGRHGLKALAALLRADWSDIEPHVTALLEDGCVELGEKGELVLKNFVEAQSAATSDLERKRRQRERDRDQARKTSELLNVDVTIGHEPSREVTNGHHKKRREENREKREALADASQPPREHQQAVTAWFDAYAQARNGAKHTPLTKADGQAVKELLKALGLEELTRRIKAAWADPWFAEHGDLLLFRKQVNKFGRGTAPPRPPDREAEFRSWFHTLSKEQGRAYYAERAELVETMCSTGGDCAAALDALDARWRVVAGGKRVTG